MNWDIETFFVSISKLLMRTCISCRKVAYHEPTRPLEGLQVGRMLSRVAAVGQVDETAQCLQCNDCIYCWTAQSSLVIINPYQSPLVIISPHQSSLIIIDPDVLLPVQPYNDVMCPTNIHEHEKLMQQPKFKEHPLLKAIMERVSRRGYMDMSAFVDDFTR